MLDRSTKSGMRILEFDNVSEYLEFVSGKSEMSDYNRSSRRTEFGGSWAGTPDFESAMRIARHGWPEGLEKISEISSQIKEIIAGEIFEREIQFDVTGDVLDIGRFVSGEPEDFMTIIETETHVESPQPKVLQIVINISTSAAISPEIMITRGAAACALIEAIEMYGKRAEVWVVQTISGSSGGGKKAELRVKVKDALDPLNMDSLAFFAAHPSSLRRINFSAWEVLDEFWRTVLGIGGTYGYPISTEEPGNIYVDRIYSASDWTMERTIKWLESTLESQGIQLKKEK